MYKLYLPFSEGFVNLDIGQASRSYRSLYEVHRVLGCQNRYHIFDITKAVWRSDWKIANKGIFQSFSFYLRSFVFGDIIIQFEM